MRDFPARDDILQDMAVGVTESFDRYDPERPFVAWALGLAQNRIRLYLRRVQRDRLVFDEPLMLALAATFEETTVEQLRPLDFLKDCLGQLSFRAKTLCERRISNQRPSPHLSD